jgi:hypothetical protein
LTAAAGLDLGNVPALCASFKAQYVDAGGAGAEDFAFQSSASHLGIDGAQRAPGLGFRLARGAL